MSDKASIVALGNAVLDLEFRGGASLLHKTRLRLNDTVLASHQEQTQRRYVLETALGQPTPMSGGSAANSLTLAAAMGVDCALMSRLGDDPEAEHYRQDLQQAGVQLLAPEKGSGRTANCLAVITPDGERTMSTELGCCAELDSKALHPKVIADSDWLLLEGYCLSSEAGRKTVFEAQQIALEAGTKIALTLSSALLAKSQRDTISQLADAGLNLIIGNQSEAQAVTHSRDARKSLETLGPTGPYGGHHAIRRRCIVQFQRGNLGRTDRRSAGRRFTGSGRCLRRSPVGGPGSRAGCPHCCPLGLSGRHRSGAMPGTPAPSRSAREIAASLCQLIDRRRVQLNSPTVKKTKKGFAMRFINEQSI